MGRVGAVFNNPVHVPDFYIFCFGRQSRVANPQEALSRDGLGVLHGVLIKKRRKHSTFSIGKKPFLFFCLHTHSNWCTAPDIWHKHVWTLLLYTHVLMWHSRLLFFDEITNFLRYCFLPSPTCPKLREPEVAGFFWCLVGAICSAGRFFSNSTFWSLYYSALSHTFKMNRMGPFSKEKTSLSSASTVVPLFPTLFIQHTMSGCWIK